MPARIGGAKSRDCYMIIDSDLRINGLIDVKERRWGGEI